MPDQPTATPAQMRADMQSMLTYIQGARIVSMARETAISRLKGWLAGRFWFGVILAASALLIVHLVYRVSTRPQTAADIDGAAHAALLSALILIMLASRVGAIISIGRRMSDDNLGIGLNGDSIFTIASLGSGRNGLALALLSANSFGLVVTAIFASGVLSTLGLNGGIAPVFTDVEVNQLRDQARDDSLAATVAKRDADVARKQCAAQPAAAAADTAPADAASTADSDPTPPDATAPDAAPESAAISESGATATGTTDADATASASDTCALADALDKTATLREADAQRSFAAVAAHAKLSPTGGSATDKWFAGLAAALGLASVPDLFKLLLWAFIAGFFETLVPDMLDTLAKRTRQNEAKEGVRVK